MDKIDQNKETTPAAEAAATQQAFEAGAAAVTQPGATPAAIPAKPGAATPAGGEKTASAPAGEKKPGENAPPAEGQPPAGEKKPGQDDDDKGGTQKPALDEIREMAAAEDAAERQRLLDAEAERLRQQQTTAAPAGKITEVVTQALADLPKLIEPLKDLAIDDPGAEDGTGKTTLGKFIEGYPGVAQASLAVVQAVLPKMLEQMLGQSIMPTIKLWQTQQTEARQQALLEKLAGDPQAEGDDKGFGHSDIYDLWNDNAKWAKLEAYADSDPLLKRFLDSGDPAKIDKVIRAWREKEGLAMPAVVQAARETRDTQRKREQRLHTHTSRQNPPVPTGEGRKPLTPQEEQRLFEEGQRTVTG